MHHARFAVLTAAAMLAIAACSSPSSPTPLVAPSTAAAVTAGDAVSIANFSFQPGTISVPVGATVTWTNNDSAGHTVTANDGSFGSDRLESGATFTRTFAKAGTFAYHCSIHSGMTGTVSVQ